jgi:starvation-inducible DNA-binding protein
MSDWNGFRVVAAEEVSTPEESPTSLVDTLRVTLSEAYVLYHTIHGFHWNLKGSDFWEYHKFFDEIVDDIYEHIDPIAENIVKLGGVAPFKMSELVSLSSIDESGLDSVDPLVLTRKFVDMNSKYLENLKSAFIIANNANEQGVANFIAERIDMHQKWNWFLKASLGEK